MKADVAHFRNELSNAITISVETCPIEGVDGVMITITGPSSTTENHITYQEAVFLHTLLGQVLMRNEKD